MTRKEKEAYFNAIWPRYQTAKRACKKQILDEFCANTGHNRKYAIGLLSAPLQRKKKSKKPGRRSKYCTPRFFEVLLCIWKTSDFMCSSRLKPVISDWLPYYEAHYGSIDDDTKSLLHTVSSATINRILKPQRIRNAKGFCGTKPGSLLRTQIPIRTDNWDITAPGFMEADTVAHCGNFLAGDFVWSLTMTDIHSAWTECRALWNKGAEGVVKQIHDVERNLPFQLLGFDCDNGSEFLNYHLVRYFSNRETPVGVTRSRPYKKNDNAHVEQKNWTHPRHLLGYDRIGNPDLVELINDLYANEFSLYQNYFCPSVKLTSKMKINSRYKRTYDVPQTPYERLMTSDKISNETKKMLTDIKKSLNPFKLKKTIERKLKIIFKEIKVTSNVRKRI